MKYSTLLFDVDGTILDFEKAEKCALESAFSHFGFNFDDYVLERYKFNNEIQWHLFEQGKICKSDILINRFRDTLEELNIGADVSSVAEYYQSRLNEGYYKIDGAEEVLNKLKQTHALYVVTNGVKRTQESRMRGSGFDKYFICSFISEEIGYPKPNKKYFDYCFEHIIEKDLHKILIIGDSLASDITGGINAGIDTCWFNCKGLSNSCGVSPTYEINELAQLLKIV